MALYWAFRLEAVSSHLLYREEVLNTESYFELDLAIERFRHQLPHLRPWNSIPH